MLNNKIPTDSQQLSHRVYDFSYHGTTLQDKRQSHRPYKVFSTPSLQKVAIGLTRRMWTPAVFRDGYRKEENFLYADFLSLDFDDPKLPLEFALDCFGHYSHIIGTTKSHRKEKNDVVCDRYRVVIPFEKRITSLDVYRANMEQVLLDHFDADPSCKDGARFYFPCVEIFSVREDGIMYEMHENLRSSQSFYKESRKKTFRAHKKMGSLPQDVLRDLTHPIPSGQRNQRLFQLAKDLSRLGFTQDQIIGVMYKTPTYLLHEDKSFHKELNSVVESALKSIRREYEQANRTRGGEEQR